MKNGSLIPWPPKKGQRFHLDHGAAITSYSAIVIAYLRDEDVVVFKRWAPHKQRWFFYVETPAFWEVYSEAGRLRSGPLPKRPRKGQRPGAVRARAS